MELIYAIIESEDFKFAVLALIVFMAIVLTIWGIISVETDESYEDERKSWKEKSYKDDKQSYKKTIIFQEKGYKDY